MEPCMYAFITGMLLNVKHVAVPPMMYEIDFTTKKYFWELFNFLTQSYVGATNIQQLNNG